MDTNREEGTAVVVHPLSTKKIGDFGMYKEWKQAWEETRDPKRLLGLLQFIFDVSTVGPAERVERLCFLLDHADGHSSNDNFGLWSPEERQHSSWDEMSERQLKRMISRKAFDVLCVHLFKNENTERKYPSWTSQVLESSVFQKVLWFLRPTIKRQVWIENLMSGASRSSDRDHHMDVAKEFAFELCKLVFEYQYEDNRSVRDMLVSAQRDIVLLLLGLGKERFLVSNFHRISIGEPEMKALELVALSEEVVDEGKLRPSLTVEEALARGESRAAEVFIILRVMQEEQVRFEKISEAKQTVDMANRKIEKLSGSPAG